MPGFDSTFRRRSRNYDVLRVRNARPGNDLSLRALFFFGSSMIFSFCLLHVVARRCLLLMLYHVWLTGFTGVNPGGMRLDISIGSPWHFFFFSRQHRVLTNGFNHLYNVSISRRRSTHSLCTFGRHMVTVRVFISHENHG